MYNIVGIQKKLTDKIFEHCRTIEDYDTCNRCRIITLLLLMTTKEIN